MAETPTFTLDTVYQLLVSEINKRLPPGSTEALEHLIASGGTPTTQDLSDAVGQLQLGLSTAVKARIISGLDVTAMTPASNQVSVASGMGFVNGKIVSLDAAKTLIIPTDSPLYYILLDAAVQLSISQSKDPTKLTLCRLVIPQPGVTTMILDDKPNTVGPVDGWIVSAKDAVFDGDQEFDEDSIEALKAAIGPVLAQTIIGTLTLSDQMKILSSTGTLEMDAGEIRIKYTNGATAAKFNKFGTFFFDQAGLERARFTAEEAAIGNSVLITSTGLQVAGPKGLTIVEGGEITLDRGAGASTIISTEKIFIGQVNNGQGTVQGVDLANADGTQIFIDINGVDGQYIKPNTVEAVSIKANTITGDKIAANTITTVNIAASTISGAQVAAGTLTADKLNIAQLSAISANLGTITAGSVTSATIATSGAGARVILEPSGLSAYNASSQHVFRVIDTGPSAGDVIFGSGAGSSFMRWNNASGKLQVANVESPDYVADTTGYKLSSTSGLEINTGDVKSATITDLQEAVISNSSLANALFSDILSVTF